MLNQTSLKSVYCLANHNKFVPKNSVSSENKKLKLKVFHIVN